MLRADFHVHTILSKHHFLDSLRLADGLNTPAEMVEGAAEKGLDCIAITDHNILFDPELAKTLTREYGIVVLAGVELYLNKKDVIAVGITKLPKVNSLAEFEREVHKQGGILIAPHPNDPLGRGHKDFKYFDAIEVVNGFGGWGSEELIATASKLEKAQVCGSDAHYVSQLGWTYCFVDAEPDQDSIIAAIKERKVIPGDRMIPKYIQFGYYFQKYILGKAIFKPALRRL